MTANQLDQAIKEVASPFKSEGIYQDPTDDQLVLLLAAACSWLSLLEADETIVEKVAIEIWWQSDYEPQGWWDRAEPNIKDEYRRQARAVLAAIVGEET